MSPKFMFLFLTFFLIVTCCTFDSNSPFAANTLDKTHQKVIHNHLEKKKQFIHKSLPGFFTEISFREGAETVHKDARNKIKELFERTKRMGRIQTVKIISWADSSAAEMKKSIGQKLVENRNDNLEMYLEGLDFDLDVRKINMAEDSKSFDSLMSRDDRLLKKSFSARTASNDSKSIVMFFLEKSKD